MAIDPAALDQILHDIARHMRAADPARMDVTFARTLRPPIEVTHLRQDSDLFTIGDDLTITIVMRGPR